jgi:hypothetical protein
MSQSNQNQIPEGVTFGDPVGAPVPPTPTATSSSIQVPEGVTFGDPVPDRANQHSQSSISGEIVNDVGNKVIVPKERESFADTMKRAVAYHNSLTPEQRQSAINKETATMPSKVAQTLGAAATTGVIGPAALAVPGEVAEALPSVLTHTISGVKAIGSWAGKNPLQAYLLFQVMKELVPNAKKAMGVIRGAPEAGE